MMAPHPVDDVLLAFPANVEHLMPDLKEIPEEYWHWTASWSCRLFTDVFFKGVKEIRLYPREGIDPDLAWRHIRAIMGTFSIKHEHKEAACRYLMDQWFSDAMWD